MKDKVIVWGVGKESQKLIKDIGLKDISYFADNSPQLHGTLFEGKKILSINDILLLFEKYLIVISTSKYEDEIKKQLLENGLKNFINAKQYRIVKIFEKSQEKKQRIILLNTHDNINIGDHAITIAELYFFRKYMTDYELLEIPLFLCAKELDYISSFITKDDLLIITGGGFLGSLWLDGGEDNVRKIVQLFTENKIIIFPQTMYFENNIQGEYQKNISKNIYNQHKDLTFCFRDQSSYQLGMELFCANVQKKYIPDMVTLLDRSDEIYVRNGILLCMREDKEKLVSESYLKELEKNLIEKKYSVKRMSMLMKQEVILADRIDAINSKLHQIQKSKIVITDRLHCLLLCAISGTPCLAFDNKSGKVHEAYHWIKSNPYICLVDEGVDICMKMETLLEMPAMVYKNENIESEFCKLAKYLKTGKE